MEPDNVDAQALAALTADLGTSTPEQAAPVAPSQETVEPGVTDPDSFTNINPAELPPDMQAIYKSLQADYTRKSQEIAPYRKLGMEPTELSNLVTWFQDLSSNPSAQLELYQNLHGFLSENGLLEAEEQPTPAPETSWLDSIAEPEATRDEPVNGLEAEVQRLAKRLKDMDDEAAIQAEAVQLWEIEQGIRETNPSYKDADIAYIYKLSMAHGGNILQGEADYRELRNAWLSEYLDAKGAVPAGHSVPPTTGYATEPVRIATLEDAERIALERIKAGQYNLYND